MPVIGDEVGLTLDRIVLATDFSPIAEVAAEYARRLAQRFSAKVTLAHVVDLSISTRSPDADVGTLLDNLRETSDEGLSRLVEDMERDGVLATAQELENYSPAEAVVNLSDKLNADLIVIGTHARHGVEKMIVGSCAEGVIRHAHCPVLTVGPKAKLPEAAAFSFDSILFATDLKDDATKNAMVAVKFAQDSRGKVYFCHVLEAGSTDISERAMMKARFEKELEKLIPPTSYEWCEPQMLVQDGDAAKKLVQIASQVHADLVVLGARRSFTWFTHLRNGVVGKVIAEARCPVMTLCGE